MSQSGEFPKYLLEINGERRFLSFRQAVAAYDSGFARVKLGQYVLRDNFTVDELTPEDRARIAEAANEYSGSK